MELNIAPLIDMVFILLIFFLVTTSFVREAMVEVERPVASTARAERRGNVLTIGVTREGRVFVEGRQVDVHGVRFLVERFRAENPRGAVLIVADRRSPVGLVIRVLDQCRMAGVEDVGIAARRPG